MGGGLSSTGQRVSSALNLFGEQKGQSAYYRTLAQDADRQTAYAQKAAQRQAIYLLKSASERSQELAASYRQMRSRQKTALAASGLTGDSTAMQQILKSSRLQAVFDQENLQESFLDAQAENEISAAERIRNLQETASQYRRTAASFSSGWKLGSNLLTLLQIK